MMFEQGKAVSGEFSCPKISPLYLCKAYGIIHILDLTYGQVELGIVLATD